jgi:hypothetical protein
MTAGVPPADLEQVVGEGFLGSTRISPDETKVAYPNETSKRRGAFLSSTPPAKVPRR